MSVILDPPRWKNGPPICPIANLPAFAEWKDALAFCNSMLGSVELKWKCRCGYWHYWGKAYAPAGATSGSSRVSEIPVRIELLAKNLL